MSVAPVAPTRQTATGSSRAPRRARNTRRAGTAAGTGWRVCC